MHITGPAVYTVFRHQNNPPMTTETLDQAAIISFLDDTVSQLQKLVLPLDDKDINTIPFAGSWTAGMLCRHVTKVIEGISGAMQRPSKPAGRNADERVAELKKTFLDFSTKMKAPGMVVPEEEVYQKQDTVDKLTAAVAHFKEVAGNQNKNELVSGLQLGDITKLELQHFVLYHTQRHLHQLENIVDALRNKQIPAGQPS